MEKEKKITKSKLSDYQKLEDVIGCKWSVAVLTSVADGIIRPGEIERHIEGISTKVLSERFRKLTAKGKSLVSIIRQIHELDAK